MPLRIILLYFISLAGLLFGYAGRLIMTNSTFVMTAGLIILALTAASLLLGKQKRWFYYGMLLFPVLIIYMVFAEDTPVPVNINLLENAARIVTPIIILLLITGKDSPHGLIKFAIAATFTSHGFLALNVFPTPDSFYFMTGKILGFDRQYSAHFLFTAGVLDIVASIGILFFNGRFYKLSLLYCILWGFVTALARSLAQYDMGIQVLFMKGILETVIRAPNFILPVVEYLVVVNVASKIPGLRIIDDRKKIVV